MEILFLLWGYFCLFHPPATRGWPV